MARDPNWKQGEDENARDAMRQRLRQAPVIGPVMQAADAATKGIGSVVRNSAQVMAPAPQAPTVPERPTPLRPGLEFNQPAGNVPSALDLPNDPNSGIAGVISGRNGLRAVTRQEADAVKDGAPAPIDTSDTTNYGGIAANARAGIRGATLGARRDANRLINPMSDEAELLRRADNETGSYFSKGFPGARNAKISALLGQIEAGNDASAAGAAQEGEAELLAAGGQIQSGLNDRNLRTEARYGLRGNPNGAAAGGDIGDMIELMQLEETKRSNVSRESESARGRLQEREDALYDFDPEKNPTGLDKKNPTHRLLANFLAKSEEDPNFADSEEGMQVGRRLLNTLTAEIDKNSTLFSPSTGAGTQTKGAPSRIKGLRVDPNDDVGFRNMLPDFVQRGLGMTPGSVQFQTESGDTAVAPLDNIPTAQNPVMMQMLQELSAKYATE